LPPIQIICFWRTYQMKRKLPTKAQIILYLKTHGYAGIAIADLVRAGNAKEIRDAIMDLHKCKAKTP